MKRILIILITLTLLLIPAAATSLNHTEQATQSSIKVLFIGNSFTFGWGSAVRFYRATTVTDLNKQGIGGVPALFKSFTQQVNLDYDVFVETRGGSALDFHLAEKRDVIGTQAWDQVAMHGFSTLDSKKPGDPTLLIETSANMASFLIGLNPKAEVYLTSTWSRADLIYQEGNLWSGTSVEKMAIDIRAGHNKAASASSAIKGVNPVGEAWTRAMKLGIADSNPYDGIDFGKISLWTWDHYHASTHGYYLHALVVFGNLTGKDPRLLGENECSAFELGISSREAKLLQQAAFEQLASENLILVASKQALSSKKARRACT
ncbi:PEP-CTERM sorting domain-containing protein [Glaciecola petra]|uniref:PEP-CTERM sorting domain-containing protein n=1 Tax=Glaciecola petra TaxID=3075602 RepID=A0ABU2ZP93_9ALTE|nr:PEP-CTERM sorting domain-containing protein [Aestuariibacter sp. P117]MDT0593272.1 PEP-CTERM sorting domain-containing protein [Aestuariibacter sp. P117]